MYEIIDKVNKQIRKIQSETDLYPQKISFNSKIRRNFILDLRNVMSVEHFTQLLENENSDNDTLLGIKVKIDNELDNNTILLIYNEVEFIDFDGLNSKHIRYFKVEI